MFQRIEKMDRRTLAAIAIAVVVGLLLFGAVAGVIRQAGWNEGFLAGLVNSGSLESGSTAAAGELATPYGAARGYGMHGGFHGWGWHPFWIIGGFFRFLFFAFLLMLLFKFIARRRWARHGSYGHGPWGHHGRHHHERHHWGPHHSGPQATPEQADTATQSNDPMPGDTPQTSWTQV